MIRRAVPPPHPGKYAFTGPPPATVEAMEKMGHRLAWVRNHTSGGKGVRPWVAILAERGFPLDPMTVSRYERAELQVPAAYVVMVSRVGRVDPGWLLVGKGKAPEAYSEAWERPSTMRGGVK